MKNRDGAKQDASWKNKIENFWYYYKTPVIIGLIVLLVVGFLISERSDSVSSDLNISLVTAEAISEGTINFDQILSGAIQDANGDGETHITISRLFLGADMSDDSAKSYAQMLESQLANQGATLFIFDQINYERNIKKDAFSPLDMFLDVSAYGDRVLYRDNQPIALHLAGSRILSEMAFENDDLYALLLFQRPGEDQDPVRRIEFQNAAAVLRELMKQ